VGRHVPRRDPHGRRARRPAPPQARPARADPDRPRRRVQGRPALRLRTRLFASISLIVVLSIAVTYVVGLALTRTSVERANLDDLGHQADLLAQRERASLLPLAHLDSLRPYLAKQHEQAQVADLSRASVYLPDDARARVR